MRNTGVRGPRSYGQSRGPRFESLFLFNRCGQLTYSLVLEMVQREETFPNLKTLHLDTLKLPNPLAIASPKDFVSSINVVFPALDYLNLEGDWSFVSEDNLKAIVRNSADKKLMVATTEADFVDKKITHEEFLERTSENGGSYFNNSRKCFFC